MIKIFEKLAYSFGINLSCYSLKEELRLLKENLPTSYLNREVIDIGCGDGKTSLQLKKILRPKSFIGLELSPALAKAAARKGIEVKNADVETENPSGDLGILWGALHHFENPKETLIKIVKNFNSLIIREPLNKNRAFESGARYDPQELLDILNASGIDLKQCKNIQTPKEKSIIIFFDKNL
ncbi:MAG: class I SAM-dependent methyltransferase [bacterium]|nr:class I SAM-dependent methyltransferase [bacterium]